MSWFVMLSTATKSILHNSKSFIECSCSETLTTGGDNFFLTVKKKKIRKGKERRGEQKGKKKYRKGSHKRELIIKVIQGAKSKKRHCLMGEFAWRM